MSSGNGHLEVVQVLLAAGVNTEVGNESASRPLHWAALNGHVEVCQARVQQSRFNGGTRTWRKLSLH